MTEPTLILNQGAIRGTTGTNVDGGIFYKFLGIPFAKPPLGPLRFKAPQTPEPWEGTRDCTHDGNSCLTMGLEGKTVGSEDCLYLNVHVKELPRAGAPLKPVMVFIHGGGFTMGDGTQKICGPDYLLTQDIVLVTINYRLGIFGFLSLEDTSLEVPGNAGLKDQTFALKWVQENISSFNGDPNNVTIFGISAGGASVQFQLLTPTTKGLFHKAIVQSGSVFDPWAWGQRNAQQVAANLGQNTSDDKEALEVLQEAKAEDLHHAALQLEDNILNFNKRRPFGPIIEKPNPTAFLTEDPAVLLASGRFQQVPLIQGVCSNEGHLYELMKLFRPRAEPFNKDNNLVPWHLKTKPKHELLHKLKNLYYTDVDDKEGIHDHISDVGFLVGTIHSLNLIRRSTTKPVYLYLFNYETDVVSNFKRMLGLENSPGVGHGSDGFYIIPSEWIPQVAPLTEADKQAITKMVGIWTSFARNGHPHPLWEPVRDEGELHHLLLDKETRMEVGLFPKRINLWKELLEASEGFDLFLEEQGVTV